MRTSIAGLCAVLGLLAPSLAQAQAVEEIHSETGFALFADSDDTTIWTPQASVGATVPGEVEVDVSWSADIISSASVDVVSAATPHMTEVRNQVGPRFRRENLLPNADLDVGYVFSRERDASSHTADIGVQRGFQQDNYELGLRYGISANKLGLAQQPSAKWRSLLIHTFVVSGARVLDPRTVAQVSYSFFYSDGYHANPYRRVPVSSSGDLVGASYYDEQVPDLRLRHAFSAQLQRMLGQRWVTSGGYRLYLDDWGVSSHTVEVTANLLVSRAVTGQMRGRATLQGAASFYKSEYETELEYMTRDRRLSAHKSGVLGAALAWTLGPVVLRAHFDVVAWSYSDFYRPELTITNRADFVPLGTVLGTVTMIGLELRP